MSMRMMRLALVLLASLLAAGQAVMADEVMADERLAPDRSIEEVVDHHVDAGIVRAGAKAANRADDATLARRLTLDLVGRIPTAAETRAFVASTDADKVSKLVDRLMASPGFVRHQADTLDALLMAGSKGSLRDYLARALGESRSWDRVFREVMAADESNPGLKGSAEFLKARAKDGDRLTNDVSIVFFGVNVSCAKCHDHPLVKDWKQDHYYGMKSFLDRTFLNGTQLGEHEYGVVKYKTTEGREKKARFLFLTDREVEVGGPEELTPEARKAEKERLAEAKKKNEPPAAPAVSARRKLVEVALGADGGDFFARSIVNRTWARLFGPGLVMPLDQMHSENPPSHPELLRWLARDAADHGYDLRRLIRGLVLSRAYARDGRSDSAEIPDARLFAVAAPRPLTPLQLAASMWVATTDPAALPDDPAAADAGRRVEPLAERGRDLASKIARPGDDYQIGASEALLMSNGDKLNDLLSEGAGRLVARMAQLPDRAGRVDLAVRNVLSRPPDDDEAALLAEYLARRDDRPAEAARQLVWALLTGGEFRFNH